MSATFSQKLENYFSSLDSKPKHEIAAIKSCCAWLNKNPDNWDKVSLQNIEQIVLGKPFWIGEYHGSKHFGTDQNWEFLFQQWIDWLKDRTPTLEEGSLKTQFVKNYSKLESALEDPKILEKDPYLFLGIENGMIYLTFTNDKFVMRYFLQREHDMPPNVQLLNKERFSYLYNHKSGGVIGVDEIKTTDFKEDSQTEPIVLQSNFRLKGYIPIHPSDLLKLADKSGLKYSHITSEDEEFWFWQPTFRFSLDEFPEELEENEQFDAEMTEFAIKSGRDRNFIHNMIQQFKNSAFAGSFPDVPVGGRLTKVFFSRLSQEKSLKGIVPSVAKLADIAYEVYSSRRSSLVNRIGYEPGGRGTAYIRFENEPERSYEYLGDDMMRLVRKTLVKGDSQDVSAFFGWIGRILMKSYAPETKTSFEEHMQLSEDEKKELVGELKKGKKDLRLSVFEKFLTKFNVNDFREQEQQNFMHGKDIANRTNPELAAIAFLSGRNGYFSSDTENPLKTYAWQVVGSPDYTHDLASEYTLYKTSSLIKKWFGEKFEEEESKRGEGKGRWVNTEDWFNELSANSEQFKTWLSTEKSTITPEDWYKQKKDPCLLQQWFRKKRKEFSDSYGLGAILIEKRFKSEDTYTCFVDNEDMRKGYYFAQQNLSSVLPNIGAVLQMPAKEIQEKFMKGGMPHYYILRDRRD